MRLAALAVLIVAGIIAATTKPISAQQPAASCGSKLWDLKTVSDARRMLIYLRPRFATIAAINARPMPRSTPVRRSRGFEHHVWRVVAQITDYKLEDDGDIHLILFDHGDYMIAEMPSAACLPRTTRKRRAIINTRRLFESSCGAATTHWQSLGAVAYLSGVGFWDLPHGQRGHARNYAELHPVTGIRFIAGC